MKKNGTNKQPKTRVDFKEPIFKYIFRLNKKVPKKIEKRITYDWISELFKRLLIIIIKNQLSCQDFNNKI